MKKDLLSIFSSLIPQQGKTKQEKLSSLLFSFHKQYFTSHSININPAPAEHGFAISLEIV